MSFSADVKKELSRVEELKKCCMLAEISGFLRLSGSIQLAGGGKLSLKLTTEDPAIALRRCYGREMRCLAAYEARSGDSEYGPVFVQMAQQEREHCKNILHLLGKLDPR